MPGDTEHTLSDRQLLYRSMHASAGSGKTYQLVSQVVRLLLLGVEPASILAITFTRKAATEMQERLLERVYELATLNDNELDTKITELQLDVNDSYRQNARNLYETLLHNSQGVRTTTFHAFCQDLLRRFPMEAEIPPGFELVERTGYLIDEAWNNLENELTGNPKLPVAEHFDTLLTRMGPFITRMILNRFIQARSEWWAFSGQPGFSIENYLTELAAKLGTEKDAEPVTAFFSQLDNIDGLEQFHELIARHKTRDHESAGMNIEQALNEHSDPAERFKHVWAAFFTTSGTARKRKESGTLIKSIGPEGCKHYLQLHEQFCDRLTQVRQQLHGIETLNLTRAWLYAGEAFVNRYQQIKKNHRHLDFADLEWQCYKLLNASDHADWVQYKLDQRIDHLLIDEFQDTNQTQWQLVLPLLRELAAAEQERLRSVLIVGDAKQSIYRFRRAEPGLFAAASQWLEKNLDAGQSYLARSWRSSPAIINFVNRLFENNDTFQLSDFQRHDTVKTGLPGAVELLPLSIKPETQEESTGALRNPLTTPLLLQESVHYLEAQQVAGKIREIINSEMIIQEGENARAVDYGDIMVLLRNRTHAADYEQALREAHIPYMGTERGTLLESLEIRDMVNLLQWLITPFDNHALAGVLRSPLFSATEQDLYPLVKKGNWFETILRLQESLASDSPLARAAYHLQNWMQLTEILPVHDLLDRIYSEANVIQRYRANYPEHLQSRVQANLTRFIELALENDSGRYPSLTRFLGWLRLLKQQDHEAPDQPASNSEHNRVRMLTIHESKGLESPIVILIDAASIQAGRNRDGTTVLIDWPIDSARSDNESGSRPVDFFITPSAKIPNSFCEKLEQVNAEKEAQEEANLLYVAVTRAMQYLYISGAGKFSGWYENICRQYDLDEDSVKDRHDLESHEGRQQQPVILNSQPEKPVEPDPRLQQPVPVTANLIDITPSKTLYGQHALQGLLHKAEHVDAETLAGRERGILIHRMIEALSRQPDLSLAGFCQSQHIRLQPDDMSDYWQQAAQTISHFPRFFHADQYDRAYSEVPIQYRIGKAMVNGIIDRLIIKQDEVTIIDFKSHALAGEQQLQELASQYRSQLSFYKEGIALLYPDRSIKTCLVFTSLPACIEVDLDVEAGLHG